MIDLTIKYGTKSTISATCRKHSIRACLEIKHAHCAWIVTKMIDYLHIAILLAYMRSLTLNFISFPPIIVQWSIPRFTLLSCYIVVNYG